MGKKSFRERNNKPFEYKTSFLEKILVGFFENPLINLPICGIIGIIWGFIEGANEIIEFVILSFITMLGGMLLLIETRVENEKIRIPLRMIFCGEIFGIITYLLGKNWDTIIIWIVLGVVAGFFAKPIFKFLEKFE